MSISTLVFLDRARMPSPSSWAAAIRSAGFEMILDDDFDPDTFSGFLPCKYKDADGGFEFFMDSTENYREEVEDELPAEYWDQIGTRDAVVDFVTHSSFRDLMTSVIASGVLCAISDGVLLDTESGEVVSSLDAIKWSRTGEEQIAEELGRSS